MFGLDEHIASFSNGTTVWLVVAVAILLGLRHALDPDHIAAVTTLVANRRDRAVRRAARLGLAWGAGHATTLIAFGLPVILLNRFLPEWLQRAAETAVGIIIVALAVRLLQRWRRGFFLAHAHRHVHGGVDHAHVHAHAGGRAHDHPHRERTPLGAFGIGLVHGMAGSGGAGVLIIASTQSPSLGAVSLGCLSVATALSMCACAATFASALRGWSLFVGLQRVIPVLGALSLGFGVFYTVAALGPAL
jgi:ABC-type nickel/cobalt efflux system permease component RcnA